jgi:hypothetical protein
MGHIATLENLTKPDITATLENVPIISPKKGMEHEKAGAPKDPGPFCCQGYVSQSGCAL